MEKHFRREEFACQGNDCCGHSSPISPVLLYALEKLRSLCGDRAIHVNSGFRCNKHNVAVGGSEGSQHTLGLAADIAVPHDMTPQQLANMAKIIPEIKGIGLYSTWVHVDVREGSPVWW
jgi:uncharacterized protein YcbK (DUF882 family)